MYDGVLERWIVGLMEFFKCCPLPQNSNQCYSSHFRADVRFHAIMVKKRHPSLIGLALFYAPTRCTNNPFRNIGFDWNITLSKQFTN